MIRIASSRVAVLGSASRRAFLSRTAPALQATPGKVKVTFVTQKGERVVATPPIGMTLMEAARDVAKLDIEAACDGTCACSTCHVYLSQSHFAKLKEPSEDELDMLDLAPKPMPTSRLACQVTITAELDGMEVTLPSEQSNQLS